MTRVGKHFLPFCDLKTAYTLSIINKNLNKCVEDNATPGLKRRFIVNNYGPWIVPLNINVAEISICHIFGLFMSWKATMHFSPHRLVNDSDVFEVNVMPIVAAGKPHILWKMFKLVCIFKLYYIQIHYKYI